MVGHHAATSPALVDAGRPRRCSTSAGLVGAVLAWLFHVILVVLLTTTLGAAILAVDVSVATTIAGGDVPPSFVMAVSSLGSLAVSFVGFLALGLGFQAFLVRLALAEADDESPAWGSSGDRSDWEPPDI
ncbi:hypothetical protein VB779_14480 [Haloarculaceae archaeon H-GB11]|nr:hypothetical protein [Haloarculaceae archaeon H-GB11]